MYQLIYAIWKVKLINYMLNRRKTDKLDDKLVAVPVDLSKLSNVVKDDGVKKNMYKMIRLNTLKIKYLILLT